MMSTRNGRKTIVCKQFNTLDDVLDLKIFPILYSTLIDPKLKNSIRFLRIFGVKGCKVIFGTNGDRVYSYGLNRDGSLGIGTFEEHIRKPQLNEVLSGKQIVDIAPGFEHCLALAANGQVYACGQNRYGQLGIANIVNQCTPQLVKDLSDLKVTQISCGAYFSMALTSDGELFSWGHNTFAQLGDRTYNSREIPTQVLIREKVVSISCGSNHSIALTESGVVYIWGNNTYGQLGRHPDKDIQKGRLKPMSNRPRAIQGLPTICKAICGPNHSLLLSNDGYLYAFGLNTSGQIGNGSVEPQCDPVRLNNNNNYRIKDIITFYDNEISIAVSENNKCFIWGLVWKLNKVLKPKQVSDSSECLINIYGKFAMNKTMYKTVIVNDLDRVNCCDFWLSESNGISISKDFTPNNQRNEFKLNSNLNENQIKVFAKEINISPRNQFNDEEKIKGSENFEKVNVLAQNLVLSGQSKRENNSLIVYNSGKEFLKHLYRSFNNPDNYDLKIKSGFKVIYCHKTILKIRNKCFWELLEQEISEDANELTINPKSNELFYAFLQYMYGIEPEVDFPIVNDLRNMAKIFCEPELETLCEHIIKKSKNQN